MISFDNVAVIEIVFLGARDSMYRRIDLIIYYPTEKIFLDCYFQKSETFDQEVEARQHNFQVSQNMMGKTPI